MVHNCLLLMSNANNIHKKSGGGGVPCAVGCGGVNGGAQSPVAKLNAVGWGG